MQGYHRLLGSLGPDAPALPRDLELQRAVHGERPDLLCDQTADSVAEFPLGAHAVRDEPGARVGVESLGCGVWGLELGVQGSGVGVQGSRFGVYACISSPRKLKVLRRSAITACTESVPSERASLLVPRQCPLCEYEPTVLCPSRSSASTPPRMESANTETLRPVEAPDALSILFSSVPRSISSAGEFVDLDRKAGSGMSSPHAG